MDNGLASSFLKHAAGKSRRVRAENKKRKNKKKLKPDGEPQSVIDMHEIVIGDNATSRQFRHCFTQGRRRDIPVLLTAIPESINGNGGSLAETAITFTECTTLYRQ
ncbi:hypothetical protein EJD04_26480 [Salmonella enterica]|uniref:Uncharacterized protein n=1 Tax=Salmonella newport TaxID=108619 RepID=A0A5U9KY28_SALNE|nr:hypothetical protein [Salmonella enterica subsp. enterica serovar Pensacola]EAN5736244.1 hypothetical protein [Salmonella enterica]EBS2696036.1 hypothetical protein [Salmonella enterica subsp. enterica serovar Newport]PUO38479.1 hypothetical protein DAY10_24560 [Salmonella enterica subsp. enterica]PUO59984.1 hypothetical protein DAX55_23995 [Salmonella enterica subsp. enterica]